MTGSLPVGHLAGAPLRVHWSAPLLAAVLAHGLVRQALPGWSPGHSAAGYTTAGAGAAVALLACLLLHEAAHALAARRAHLKVTDITVWALGGTTRCDRPASPKAALVIAAAGPATSLAVGVLALGTGVLLRPDAHWTLVTALLAWLGGASLVLGVVNLLPAAPMDGGQTLQAALWWRGADRDGAEQTTDRASQAVGLLLAALGTALLLDGASDGLWLMAVGLFLAASAAAERRRSVLESTLRGVRVADAMSSPVETGPDWLTVERFRTEIAANRHHCALVLVDFDGLASGLITRRQLAAVPPERRNDLRVRDVMTPLALCTTAEPDEPLAAVIQRSAVATAGRIIVLDSGGPTGVVTAHDVTRLLQLRRLDLPQSSPVQQ